jgi:hypothetical protein
VGECRLVCPLGWLSKLMMSRANLSQVASNYEDTACRVPVLEWNEDNQAVKREQEGETSCIRFIVYLLRADIQQLDLLSMLFRSQKSEKLAG